MESLCKLQGPSLLSLVVLLKSESGLQFEAAWQETACYCDTSPIKDSSTDISLAGLSYLDLPSFPASSLEEPLGECLQKLRSPVWKLVIRFSHKVSSWETDMIPEETALNSGKNWSQP